MTDTTTAVRDVLTDARTEATRADAKATALLALVGVALTGVLSLTQRPFPTPALVFLWAVVFPLAYAVVRLLLCILPRLGTSTVPGTWLHAATAGPASLYEALTTPASEEELLRGRCFNASRVAALTLVKFSEVRHAIGGVLLAVALLAVAIVLNVAL